MCDILANEAVARHAGQRVAGGEDGHGIRRGGDYHWNPSMHRPQGEEKRVIPRPLETCVTAPRARDCPAHTADERGVPSNMETVLIEGLTSVRQSGAHRKRHDGAAEGYRYGQTR